MPANIGELTLTLDSELNKHKQIFAPNVLILDQNMTPAAFFPSNYFTYQQPGVMTADRLGGVMRLTPALGQQKLYVLVFTTEKDLQQTTTLLDPAKAYAKGAGNAAPDIPDPIAKHTTDGVLSDTETYFNNGIKQAVKQGDIDKALKLMNEAERLGSKSARSTFISSVKGKG